jgi:hypothetical protein
MVTIKINYFPIIALTVLGTSSRYTNMNEIYMYVIGLRIVQAIQISMYQQIFYRPKCPVCGASCRKTQR